MYDVLKGDLQNLDGRQKTLVLQSSGQTKRLTLAPDCKFLGPDGAVLQGVPPLEKLGLFSRKPCPITVDLEKGRVTRIELPALFAKSLVRSAPRPSTTKTWVGKPAPELALRLTHGQTLTSEELRGKVVLLDFWATWCGPCQKIPPILQKLHARYEGKGLFIVGTNCSLEHGDTRAVVAGYARKHRYQYPFAYGGDKLARTLGIRVIPMLVLIDHNGIVCYVQEGLTDALEATLVKQIERLL